MEMEKIIDAKIKGKTPAEVTELNLDNCRSAQVSGLTDKFTNLETLSLINAGLTTLKGFPRLPNLKLLEMSDNRISNGLENLAGCENIIHLNLSGNKIADVAALEPLKEMKELRTLDLFNCDVTQAENYRTRVFEMIPHLKYLDGLDRDEREAEDDEDDEDFDGEGEGDEDDDDEDYEGEGEYVQSSKAHGQHKADGDDEGDDDDEGEDDFPEGDEEDDEEAAANGSHGTKRKHEDDDDD